MTSLHFTSLGVTLAVLACAALGCTKKPAAPEQPAQTSPRTEATQASSPASSAPATATEGPAQVGQTAPDFELAGIDSEHVRLSQYRGKPVVLEWFNPDCPFVRLSHTKGSLVGLAARHQKEGVVWLAINSAAPGKQGHDVERNRQVRQEYQLSHPILLDESGRVGKAYGAKRTPHLFVIDAQGTLVYAGAVDNSPDGEGESAPGGKLVNYVDAALDALSKQKPVAVPSTEAYGCSVKYGS